jgi:outer membrane protein insertion porin family
MRRRRRFARRAVAAPLLALLALGALALAAAPPAALAEEAAAPVPLVREIVVTGTRMVDEATVRARIASREGAPYDPDQVSRDVRAIYELGSFADVGVDAEGFEGGLRLTFRLAERPFLREVEFEGNKAIEIETLREKAAFALDVPYNPATVAAAVERVRALYREKGYYQVLVRTDVEPVGEGQARLKVVVEEGEKYKLVEVGVRGAKALPEDTVRKQLKTSPWTILSWATDSGKFPPELLQEDRQRLVNYYHDHGYLDVRAGEPEVVVDDTGRTVRVFFSVAEGEQYRLGAIALQGDDLVPLEEIRRLIGVKEGEVFNRSAFTQGVAAVNRRYASRGYAFVRVDYSTRLDPVARTIAVTFLVERGPEAHFGRVTITGNVTTRDRVIRRELTFAEGDVFSSDALQRSRQKVMNLGHFEQVDLIPRPREGSVIDVDIEVKERLTGQIEFGVTYSPEDGVMGRLRLAETNLFGRGQTLQLMLERSSSRANYSVTFYEPSILDGPWSAGFSVYNLNAEYDDYDQESIGGRLRVGRSLFEYVRGEAAVKHEKVTVDNIDADASTYIKEQEGTAITNSLRLSLTRDTRDNFMNPTKGNRTSVSGEYAGGVLGGDNYFTKEQVEHSLYVPLFWRFIGMVHGEYGSIQGFDGREVPINEKFFMGGSNSMRGFDYRDVGPKDENGDPIGGTQSVLFNVELIFRVIPEQGLNLVVFYDTGNVWATADEVSFDALRKDWGYGVRWMSPIGPMRFEWGYIIDAEEDESSQGFMFTIGGAF